MPTKSSKCSGPTQVQPEKVPLINIESRQGVLMQVFKKSLYIFVNALCNKRTCTFQ